MIDEHILNAAKALIRANKIPNLHVRLPADELPDGGFLISCDTCDSLFLNSQNQWVKFTVRIYPSDLSSQTQDIDIESGIVKTNNKKDLIPMRIVYRIHNEYKRVIGK